MSTATLARFQRKYVVDEATGCWVWTASRDKHGYGRFTLSAALRARFAHRVAYELHVGPIPDGLTIDHLCRNRACVNPKHLEPVTLGENVLRGDSASGRNSRKTHCPRGHAYDRVTSSGTRRCSVCDAISEKRRGPRRHASTHGKERAA